MYMSTSRVLDKKAFPVSLPVKIRTAIQKPSSIRFHAVPMPRIIFPPALVPCAT